jgi:hypothetical protein
MIVLLLVGLLTQPVAASAQSTEADVMAVITRLFDGMRAGDSAVVRSTFSPEARLMSAFEREGVPTLITGSLERFVTLVGSPHEVWDEHIWDTAIRIDDRLATVWTNYAFHRGPTLSHCGVDATEGCTSGE